MALIAIVGFGMTVQMSSSNTVLQSVVSDEMRGRLMSFYTMAFMGTAPFGSLLASVGAERVGATGTIVFGGVCCIVAALLYLWRLPALQRTLRPIYVQRGFLSSDHEAAPASSASAAPSGRAAAKAS